METRTTFSRVTVISVEGKLDGDTFPQLVRKTHGIVDRGHTNLVLDLRGVTEVTSGGLVSLQTLAGYTVTHGGKLVLSGAPLHVAQVMQLMGVDQWLVSFPDVKTAQASFSSGCIQQTHQAAAAQTGREDRPRSRRKELGDLISSRFAPR